MQDPFSKDKGPESSPNGEGRQLDNDKSSPSLISPPAFLPGAGSALYHLMREDPRVFLDRELPQGDLLALLSDQERREFLLHCGEHEVSLVDIATDNLPRQGIPSRLLQLYEKIAERCTDMWLDATKEMDNRAGLLQQGFSQNKAACSYMSPLTSKLLASMTEHEAAAILCAHGDSHPFGWVGADGVLLKKFAELGCGDILCAAVSESLREGTRARLWRLSREWPQVEHALSPETTTRLVSLITEKGPYVWFQLPDEYIGKYPERLLAGLAAFDLDGFDSCSAAWRTAVGFDGKLFTPEVKSEMRSALEALGRSTPSILLDQHSKCLSILGKRAYFGILHDLLVRGASDEVVLFTQDLLQNDKQARTLLAPLVARAFLETPRLVVRKLEEDGDPADVPGYSSPSDVVSQVLRFSGPIDLHALVSNTSFIKEVIPHTELREKLLARCFNCEDPGLLRSLVAQVLHMSGQDEGIPHSIVSEFRKELRLELDRGTPAMKLIQADEMIQFFVFDSGEFPSADSPEDRAMEGTFDLSDGTISPEAWSRARVVSFSANREQVPEHAIRDEAGRLEELLGPFPWSKGTEILAGLSLSEEMLAQSVRHIYHSSIARVLVPPQTLQDLRGSKVKEWLNISGAAKKALTACCIFEDLAPTVQQEILALDPEEVRHRLALLEFGVGRQFQDLSVASLAELTKRLRDHIVRGLMPSPLSDQGAIAESLTHVREDELVRFAELHHFLRRRSPEWLPYLERAALRSGDASSTRSELSKNMAAISPLETTVSFVPDSATRQLLVSDLVRQLRENAQLVSFTNPGVELAKPSKSKESITQEEPSISPEELWASILGERLGVERGLLYLGETCVPFHEAARILTASALGTHDIVRKGLADLKDLVDKVSISVPVVVSVLSDPLAAVFIDHERFEEGARFTPAYPWFARSVAVLAQGEAAQVVTVRSRAGTLLRADLIFAAERVDGIECLLIDPMTVQWMGMPLAGAVLEWARAARNEVDMPILVTPDFLGNVGGGVRKDLSHRTVGGVESQRVSAKTPDDLRAFFLANALLTDISGFYV